MSSCRLMLLCLLVLASGCSTKGAGAPDVDAPPMTLSDFYGFCSSLEMPTTCFSDPICKRYRLELAAAPASLSQCLTLCRRTENALYVANLVNGCEAILDRAGVLCEQYCRRRDRTVP